MRRIGGWVRSWIRGCAGMCLVGITALLLLPLLSLPASAASYGGNLPGNVAYVNDSSDLKTLSSAESAIFFVSGKNVVTKKGKTLFALTSLSKNLPDGVLPILSVSASDALNAASFLKKNYSGNGVILSSSAAALTSVYEKYPTVFRVLDRSGAYRGALTEAQAAQICAEAHAAHSYAVLLSGAVLNRESVLWIRSRYTSVWSANGALASEGDALSLITSGASCVVTDAPEVVRSAAKLLGENALVSAPFRVSHRGVVGDVPENSLTAYSLAVDAGIDFIETDIYLSADGVPVILHSASVDHMTEGTGPVEEKTLAELKELHLWGPDDMYRDIYPDERIPTLAELFELMKNSDIRILLEIKSEKPEICAVTADLIREYGYEDRIALISFYSDQLAKMRTLLPSVPGGELYSAGDLATGTVGVRLRKLTVKDLFADVGIVAGAVTPEYLRGAVLRGIPTATWTYLAENRDDYCAHFLAGSGGLTQEVIPGTESMLRSVSAVYSKPTLQPDGSEQVTYRVTARYYDGTTADVTAEVIPVPFGGRNVSAKNGVITVPAGEDACGILFRREGALPNGVTYSVFTEPYSVAATAKPETPETPDTPAVVTDVDTDLSEIDTTTDISTETTDPDEISDPQTASATDKPLPVSSAVTETEPPEAPSDDRVLAVVVASVAGCAAVAVVAWRVWRMRRK